MPRLSASPRASKSRLRFVLPALAGLGLAGCSDGGQPAQPPAAIPEIAVGVVEVKAERLPVVTELPGRVAPTVAAEVRPRVTGIVQRRVFEQGSTVREGDVLYVIDPAPFQNAVASARATLDAALAAQTRARQTADRQGQLTNQGISSRQLGETAVAELAQANADVQRAQADLNGAELELRYTEIRSPISGSIGRALVTEGALISPTSDVMAIVQRIDPVYADFTQPADSLIALRSAIADGRLAQDASGNARLRLRTTGGSPYPHEGRLLFSESSVDAATGQIILRGEFPNPERNLLPGMYVRGLIEQAELANAMAVPEQAIQRDTAGIAQVYVVGAQNAVEARPVSLGWILDDRWVVLDGVKPGDKVVVEGFQRIRPGAKVRPEPWTPPPVPSVAPGRG